MVFLESAARPLMVVHAVAAAVLVGATTHHVVWCRGYLGGQFGRYKGERRFALVAAVAFAITFILGNLLYPTYKVRVRAEYFDNPQAIAAEARLRVEQHRAIDVAPRGPEPATIGASLAPIAHLFDIKEHWVALGLAASLILLALSRLAHPKDHPRVTALYLGLAVCVCATAWLGAIVGLVVTSFRAVGGAT